jgi:hypothetical protein
MLSSRHLSFKQLRRKAVDYGVEYSLFMHRTSGHILVTLAILVFMDRYTKNRHEPIRTGIGGVWIGFAVFLLIWSDPRHWPLGAGLLESWNMVETRLQWLQHRALSLIPLALGLWIFVRPRTENQLPYWGYAFRFIVILGALGLLIHRHHEHPGHRDIVNVQHQFMAMTSLLIAGSIATEGLKNFTWKLKPYLLPTTLMSLGLQLSFYIE